MTIDPIKLLPKDVFILQGDRTVELFQNQPQATENPLALPGEESTKLGDLKQFALAASPHDSNAVPVCNNIVAHGERGPTLSSRRSRVLRSTPNGVGGLQRSLAALEQLYHAHPNTEAVLKTASRLVVDMLNLEHCSICWIDEKELNIKIRTSHTRQGATVDPDQAIQATSSLVKRVRPNQNSSSCSPSIFNHTGKSGQPLELATPLRVDTQIVGYLYALRGNIVNEPFFDNDVLLFFTLSQHIGAAIEVQRVREMLDSPYVALMLSPEDKEALSSMRSLKEQFLESAINREKLAQGVARRFFQDLLGAGFETKHILCVATEIIDNLNETFRRTNPQERDVG